jgi:hypothetical protein
MWPVLLAKKAGVESKLPAEDKIKSVHLHLATDTPRDQARAALEWERAREYRPITQHFWPEIEGGAHLDDSIADIAFLIPSRRRLRRWSCNPSPGLIRVQRLNNNILRPRAVFAVQIDARRDCSRAAYFPICRLCALSHANLFACVEN